MRVSLDNFRRWWTHQDGNGNGRSHGPYPGSAGGTDRMKLGDLSTPPGNDRLPVSNRPALPAAAHNPSSEPPWLKRLDEAGIPRTLQYPTTTLGRLLDQTADRFGDAPAMAYHNARWTFRELLAEVNRLAAGLSCLGVRRGDRVLLTLPNCPEFVTTFFAIQKLGAIVVNAGPLMGQDDLREAIHLARPRVAIGLDLRADQLIQAADGQDEIEHFVWTSLRLYQSAIKRLGYQFKLWQSRDRGNPLRRAKHVTLDALLQHAPARPPTIAPDLDEVAVLQPTGGTTGSLKLARLTHRSLLANCMQVTTWLSVRYGQERMLAALPMFHVYGLTMGLLTSVFSASEMVVMTRYSGSEALDLLRNHKVTIFPLVPAICDSLSDLLEAEEEPRPLDHLRLCISGAAPLPTESAERFGRLSGACVVEGFGLTEASPVTHAGLPGDPRPGFIGLPMPDTRVRVVDLDTGDDVAPGQQGEMLIAGPQLMSGYLSAPAETRSVLQTDAAGTVWLHTGDVVRYDAEGFFQIVDRRKDMINHAGLKIFPTRVEKVLKAHPRVKDVAVVGRHDQTHTENVVAVIVPTEMPQDVEELEQDLLAHCRQHLARYEIPHCLEFMQELPRSALGKLLRKNLRTGPADGARSTRRPGPAPTHDDAAVIATGSEPEPADLLPSPEMEPVAPVTEKEEKR